MTPDLKLALLLLIPLPAVLAFVPQPQKILLQFALLVGYLDLP
jgi:hypothetical protein